MDDSAPKDALEPAGDEEQADDSAAGKSAKRPKVPLLSVPAKDLPAFAAYAWHRFGEDRCTSMASSLSYTSLLAIVPLTAIAFSMLAAFPVFEGVREQFQSMLFSNFLPQSAEAMKDYFNQFVRNTAQLTAVGIIGLALTAVLLLGTIESNLNAIFRVTKPRALVPRLLVFWALLTLGPLLLGASFSLSTYFFALTELAGVDALAGPFGSITRFVPTLIVIVMLWLFYMIIPNRPVRMFDALISAVVAGLLFAGLRKVFGYYVGHFPTYQTIYGAVSVVPIFLIWMYLSWTVILLGAELAAAQGEWGVARGRPSDGPLRSGRRLAVALSVLHLLAGAARKGASVSRRDLLTGSGLSERILDRIVTTLREAGFMEKTDKGRWIGSRDLETVTLFELLEVLELDLKVPEEWTERDGPLETWEQRVVELSQANTEAQRELMQVPLKRFLADA